MRRTQTYVRSADDTVERGCPHCQWYAVDSNYPALIKRYQSHLREKHPRAWLRSWKYRLGPHLAVTALGNRHRW